MRACLIFLMLAITVSAQTSVSTLEKKLTQVRGTEYIETLLNLCDQLWQQQPEKALDYAGRALPLAEKTGDRVLQARALSYMGYAYKTMHIHKKALTSIFKALELLKDSNDRILYGFVLNTLGIYYNELSIYDKALEYFSKAYSVRLAADDKTGFSRSLNNLGLVYYNLSKYDEALKYYSRSLKAKEVLKDKEGIARTLNNIGLVYYKKKDYKKAIEYQQSCWKISQEINYSGGMANATNNLGDIYVQLKDFTKALQYEFQSLATYTSIGDKNGQAVVLNSIGHIKFLQNKFAEAEDYLNQGLKISQMLNSKSNLQNIHENLYLVFDKQNNFQKALENYRLFIAYRDSIFNSGSNRQIAEIQVKFESDRLESENKVLLRENELRESTMVYQTAALLLALFVIIIFSYRIRTKQKANRLLNEKNLMITGQKELLELKAEELSLLNERLIKSEAELKELNITKDKFFSIISHDLRNPFSTLLGFTQMLLTDFEEFTAEEIRESISQIQKTSRGTFNLLENLLNWSRAEGGLIKLVPEKIDLADFVNEFILLLSPAARAKSINLTSEVSADLAFLGDRDTVAIVLRNLISNAIKFTDRGGCIIIKARQQGPLLLISVKDTGVGISEENMTKLFRLDAQLSTKGTDTEKGTGLGLLLCKEFVEKNGGNIWVESEPGKGSEFNFTLPRA